MPNLFRAGPQDWIPDADLFNAPEGALLRSDNVVEDAVGGLTLRAGSSLIYPAPFTDLDIRAIYTVSINGTLHRFVNAGDYLYIDGVRVGAGAFSAGPITSGDIAIGDDSYQAFFARGTTKKAYDGTTLRDWGVPKPLSAPTLSATNAITTTVAAFDNVESPAVTATEGSAAFAASEDGSANAATTLTPAATTSRGCLQRLWTTDQNFYGIKGTQGSDNDQFDILLNMAEPRDVETITVQFGVGDSSTLPFTADRYEFELDVKNGVVPEIKNLSASGYSAYESAVLALLKAIDPTVDVGTIQTPEEVKSTMAEIGSQPSPRTGGRPDAGTWSHLTIPRGQFKRIGSTPGRGWSTVRGLRITLKTRAGTTANVTFDSAIWSGGGDMSLTGRFRACIRAGRNSGKYIELSPPSDTSAPITLNHQTLRITIPAATLSALQGSADQLWIYLFGGLNLNTWYRFAVTGVTTKSGMTIDELTSPAGSDFDQIAERARLASHGFTFSQLSGDGVPHTTGTTDLTVSIIKSEEQVLSEGVRMEPYQILPPDNIVSIVGPWAGRMFVVTSDGSVWPSSNLSPSSFNSRQRLDLTRFGDPLWAACTTGGIYVGMTKDIIFLEGSGDDSADLTYIDLSPRRTNVGNPPVDRMVTVQGNTIIYRSADGLIAFTGGSANPLPFSGTELLWRGQSRHGVAALNVATGRFRCAYDNFIFYMLGPEGSAESSNVIYRLRQGKWRRLIFGQVDKFRSIFREPNGDLVAGDNAGRLWKLETGTQDNNADIPVTIWTPATVAAGPLTYVDPMDLQLHVDTGGKTGQVALYFDGASTSDDSYAFSTSSQNIYLIQAEDIDKFIRAQLRITGSFNRFVLSAFNLSYRSRGVQHYVLFDTNYLAPQSPQMIYKMQRAEVDCISQSNLWLDLYIDDVLTTTQSVTVKPNIHSVYLVPLPRGSRGRRPRVVLRTTAPNGAGATGFDLFGLRIRLRGAGGEGSAYLDMLQAGGGGQ